MLSKLGIKKAKQKYGFQQDTGQNNYDHDIPETSLRHSVSSASSTNAHFLTTHNYLQPPPPASNQYSQLLSNSSGVSLSNNNLSATVAAAHANNLSRKPTKRELNS